jgi:uncharacterized protein (TIGR03435 family)
MPRSLLASETSKITCLSCLSNRPSDERSLTKRRTVVTHSIVCRLTSRRRLIAAVWLLATTMAAPVLEQAGAAQGVAVPEAKSQPIKFDVISVRPADPGVGPKLITFRSTNNGFVATNQPLLMTLLMLYPESQLDASRVVGGPDWVRTLPWDIHAKVGDSDIAEWGRLSHDPGAEAKERRRATILAMLADRFKLTIHLETREGTVYGLVVAKGGPKIKPSRTDGPAQMRMKQMGHLVVERVENRSFNLTSCAGTRPSSHR